MSMFRRTLKFSALLHIPHREGLSLEGENQIPDLLNRVSQLPLDPEIASLWEKLHAEGLMPVAPPSRASADLQKE